MQRKSTDIRRIAVPLAAMFLAPVWLGQVEAKDGATFDVACSDFLPRYTRMQAKFGAALPELFQDGKGLETAKPDGYGFYEKPIDGIKDAIGKIECFNGKLARLDLEQNTYDLDGRKRFIVSYQAIIYALLKVPNEKQAQALSEKTIKAALADSEARKVGGRDPEGRNYADVGMSHLNVSVSPEKMHTWITVN